MKDHEDKSSFVFSIPESGRVDGLPFLDFDKLYKKSLKSRDTMRQTIKTAIESALEQLLMLERIAHAEGFVVQLVTDANNGHPWPEFDGNKVTFVQAYGVIVIDEEVTAAIGKGI